MDVSTPPPAPPLLNLPVELIEAIIYHIDAEDTISCGLSCKALAKITFGPLIWRKHCIRKWRYWRADEEFQDRLKRPPTQTKWQQVYIRRNHSDISMLGVFNKMLLEQRGRMLRMNQLASGCESNKDLYLWLKFSTLDDAPDVLARRWHADAILGMINRFQAIRKWKRLQEQQMVSLEDLLGAFDLFVLRGPQGDLQDISRELDRLAATIRQHTPKFDELTTRLKAQRIARILRENNYVGNRDESSYHELRNNFLGIPLFSTANHGSLPLPSAAIYCAIARRLGVNARPTNFPTHVHVAVYAPDETDLDGRPKAPQAPGVEAESEVMYMDPWRTSSEVEASYFIDRLERMSCPASSHMALMGGTTNLDLVARTCRNIMYSVQKERDLQRARVDNAADPSTLEEPPDLDSAWYGMLWCMTLLGSGNNSSVSLMHTRRQCLPYLVEHWQTHFPEDLGLIRQTLGPLITGEDEREAFGRVLEAAYAQDRNARAPSPRSAAAVGVEFKIGQCFRHKRFGYEGVVVGWDVRCGAEPRWIQQMRVDELPRGREQPFYNVLAEDRSSRYVAQENVQVITTKPKETIMRMAGRYFKRWDKDTGAFVSNIKDEYPDD